MDEKEEIDRVDVPVPTPVDRSWKSCCFTVNVEAAKYLSTYLISLFVLFFAFYMTIKEEKDYALWVSMITGIAGQYMPSPLFTHARPND
jgi:hypothetical protein